MNSHRCLLIIFCVILSSTIALASDWDIPKFVESLSRKQDVDKTILINRENHSDKIVNATYDFRFQSKKLYSIIQKTLNQNSQSSAYYYETGKGVKTILMRTYDKKGHWNFKLHDQNSSEYQFLVTFETNKEEINIRDNAKCSGLNDRIQEISAERTKLRQSAREIANEARKTAKQNANISKQSKSEVIIQETEEMKKELQSLKEELAKAKKERNLKLKN